MTFKEWWKTYQSEVSTYFEEVAASDAWNAALEEGAKAIESCKRGKTWSSGDDMACNDYADLVRSLKEGEGK